MSPRIHRDGPRAIGPATCFLAVLLFAGCQDGSPLAPDTLDTDGSARLAANASGGAVVNSQANNVSGEVPDVHGTAVVQCLNRGTQISIHVGGARPNALYTIWLLRFDPGSPPVRIGIGALGGQTSASPNDGYRNVFSTSATGEGQITRLQPAGDLSINGMVPGCLLDADEFHVAAFWHDDGLTWGATPKGAGGTGKIDFGFVFVN